MYNTYYTQTGLNLKDNRFLPYIKDTCCTLSSVAVCRFKIVLWLVLFWLTIWSMYILIEILSFWHNNFTWCILNANIQFASCSRVCVLESNWLWTRSAKSMSLTWVDCPTTLHLPPCPIHIPMVAQWLPYKKPFAIVVYNRQRGNK